MSILDGYPALALLQAFLSVPSGLGHNVIPGHVEACRLDTVIALFLDDSSPCSEGECEEYRAAARLEIDRAIATLETW